MRVFTRPQWYCQIHGRWYKRPVWIGVGGNRYPVHLGCGKPLVLAVVAAWEPSEVAG